MTKHFFTCILLFNSLFAVAQSNTNNDFVQFATKQNELFVDAYKKQDVGLYNTLLKEFLKKYEDLKPEEQKAYAPYYINAYYNLSCAYSLLNNKRLALASLEKAIKAGYSNYAHLLQDSDLDNIRKEKAYETMVQPLRELGDYKYMLRKDNRFTTTDSMQLPAFTYQAATQSDLMRLRQQFNLDSIAGAGNEVSKFINLLHWVHNTIPHDGQHESGIQSINGLEIASVATAKKIGVSCGELATLLNDCYLAMGFQSRKVYCFPKDSLRSDYDSHVINMVYSKQQKKWLWMDPTHDAYVMNEKGELLGIEEVRARLINNQPMIVNPDANWNRKASTLKANYIDNYMAKNLYRFYCALESGFDIETRGKEKTVTYVNLVPTGYGRFKDMPAKKEYYNKDLKTTFVHYTTSNPSAFWQVPN